MEIADQMQDEFQGDQPFFGIGAGVGEFGRELLDLIGRCTRVAKAVSISFSVTAFTGWSCIPFTRAAACMSAMKRSAPGPVTFGSSRAITLACSTSSDNNSIRYTPLPSGPPVVALVGRQIGNGRNPPDSAVRPGCPERPVCAFAVGTSVAGRPPHRSGRAGFPHPAPTLGV